MDLDNKIIELEKRTSELENRLALLEKVEKPIVAAPVIAPDFDILKSLLESDRWSPAVNPALICEMTSDQDKEERAEGILEFIVDANLENQSFLDFGCGEGHVVKRTSLQKPKVSVGYDIVSSEKWNTWEEKPLLTTDWEVVKANAPYNAILIYDVLDHMASEVEIIGELKKIRQLTAPGGRVFARMHPWCSRHANHLYHKLNKAFIHLVFTPEELEMMGLVASPMMKIVHPILTYENWFRKAGFTWTKPPQVDRVTVERFFTEETVVANRIKTHWKGSQDTNLRNGIVFPIFQLEQQFLDMTLI